MPQIGAVTIGRICADDLIGRCDLLFILLQQFVHNGIILHGFIIVDGNKLGRRYAGVAVGGIYINTGGADALVIVTTVLQVVYAVFIHQTVALVGMRFEYQIHIAVGKAGVIIGG